MKRFVGIGAITLVLTGGAALAQQTPSQPGMGGQAHQMPMGGMCPMMGGMMGGGGMMSMMGGQAESPRMMQIRGEMLRAMGDVLIQYGKAMEGGSR